MRAAAGAFASMGGHVSIDGMGENLVRRLLAQGQGGDLARGARREPTWPVSLGAREIAGPPRAQVEAQGLPNLVHELVHALFAGRLDDDHGIDYGAIPFDLDTSPGRALLFEELTCCALSCEVLEAELRRRGEGEARRRARVDAWFREQVEIQPVFFGMDEQPEAFAARVSSLLEARGDEAQATVTRAREVLRSALGEPPWLGDAAPTLAQRWAGLRGAREADA